MKNSQELNLREISNFAADIHSNFNEGHDFEHIQRVVELAKELLQDYPQADEFLILAACYLHDTYDEKLFDDSIKQKESVKEFLKSLELGDDIISQIFSIIDNMSFAASLDGKAPLDLNGQIVQDADRIDSLGPIAVTRALQFGWYHNIPLYNLEEVAQIFTSKEDYRKADSSTITHFKERLFLLKDMLNTKKAQDMCLERDKFIRDFVAAIEAEWVMDNPDLLNDEKLVKIRDFAYNIHSENNDGHDFNHIRRVAGLAQKILETYSHVDKFTVLATVYLHDCYDQKLFVDSLKQKAKVINFLSKLEIDQDVIDKIIYIIDNMSFSANMDGQKELDLVGQIVQDADRLDSMGAIAINRVLEYGWSHSRKLYDPSIKPRQDLSKDEYRNSEGTTINHFYEKLFLLSDKLNTEEARELAKGRNQIMHDFVTGIERDWIEVS